MRLITVNFLVGSFLFAFVANGLATRMDYVSGDTVVVEALDDFVEETTTIVSEALPTERQMRQENGENQCVTNSGMPGACEPLRECFPRLFPVDPASDDTPGHSGVYNQNLLKVLIDASGFCGETGSRYATPYQGAEMVCCRTVRVEEFPVQEPSNETIDTEFQKKPCGYLKLEDDLPPPRDKIVGGRPAALGEYPWTVAMIRRGQQFCGASLIDSKNILTAAHCVEFMNKNDVLALRLNIGDLDVYSSKETNHIVRKAKRVLYHKGFSMKNLHHDIALIHLDKPVEFSKTVQPVCLHPGNPPYDTGTEEADVSGWGTTSSGGSQSSKLLAVTIRVITQKECSDQYAKASKQIGPGMVCAGSMGKDSCQGDSGGPLVVDPRGQAKQIGIVSWGIGCASYPGVYTRVDKYMKWINKNKQ